MSAPRDAIQLSLVPDVDGQTMKEDENSANMNSSESSDTGESSDEASFSQVGASPESPFVQQNASLPSDDDEEELPLSVSSSGELNITLSPIPAALAATGGDSTAQASGEPCASQTDATAEVKPDAEAGVPATSAADSPAEPTSESTALPSDKQDADSPAPSDISADSSDDSSAAGGGGGDEPPVPAVTHAQDAGGPPPEANEEPMTLIDHLNELRHRLTRVVILVLLGFFACYGVSEPLYAWLSAPLTAALPAGSKLIYTSPQGAFFVYMKVALVASIFLTSPFTFYQLWSFIAPGLYKEEKQAIMPLAFFSAFFFLAGASFCYYLVFPIAFQFFMGFATDLIVPMISVEEYLSFALKLLIAFGLVFEMPLFAYFLARMGLLTAEMMRRQRKYAILAIFVIAAILTPPDVFSQCLMAAPMLLLYEVSIYVAKSVRKNKDEKGKTPDASPEDSGTGDSDETSATSTVQEEK